MAEGSNNENPKSLAEVGFLVLQVFETITQCWGNVEDHKGLEAEKVTNEQDRFNLWAIHLGLHQRGHASLDYRFRDAENLYQYSMKLLDDLLHALKSVHDDLFSKPNPIYENREPGEVDDSLSGSDDSDSLEGFDDETLAQAAFKSVSDSIDRLFKLAMRVRNPATRTGFSRGYHYDQFDPDSGMGLFNTFLEQRIDERYIENLVNSYGKPVLEGEHDVTFLVDRLAKANNKRRRQFAYWKHHKLNQVKHTEMAKQKIAQQLQFPGARAPSTSGHSKPTTATYVDHTKIDLEDSRSVFSTVSMMLPEPTKSEEVLEFPPVPQKYVSDEDIKEFECPYCFTICSKRLLQKKLWR
jgi:hypothetical protein